MRRILNSILAFACILLGALVVAGWVRSYYVCDSVCRAVPALTRGTAVTRALYGEGAVRLVAVDEYRWLRTGWSYDPVPVSYARSIAATPSASKLFGFSYARIGGIEPGWAVGVPFWFLLLLAAVFPVWHFGGGRWRLRRERRRLGLCERCGYDLRANSGRCPECGQPAPATPPTVPAKPQVPDTPTPKPLTRWRRIGRRIGAFTTVATVLALLCGMTGQATRDRNLVLALMMYIPLVPLGLWAVALDGVRRGRSIPRARFALAALGLGATAWGGFLMTGGRAPDRAPMGSSQVSILHWNVMWAGRNATRWHDLAREIRRRDPDLVVLSEAPPDDMVVESFSFRAQRASAVYVTNEPGERYWYNPMVCSRGPLKREWRIDIANGAAMSVLAEVRGRTVRLLVVDGKSDPRIGRTPMLHDIAAACDRLARRGQPVDVIVGDFNAVGRSIGFDAFAAAGEEGYRRSSDYGGGWRATWPAPVPVYDIDHLWVRNDWAVIGCELFSARGTDHRGQFVRVALPPRR